MATSKYECEMITVGVDTSDPPEVSSGPFCVTSVIATTAIATIAATMAYAAIFRFLIRRPAGTPVAR